MALSILQFPASCSLAQSPIVFSVSESSAANTSASFQYNADLYYWTGTPSQSGSVKYTLVKYPNTSNVGMFDFSKIVNSTLTDLREENSSNVVYFKGDFYFSYRSGSGYGYGTPVSTGVYKAIDGYGIFQEPIGQQIVSKSEFWPMMTDGPSTQSVFDVNTGTFGVYTDSSCNKGVSHLFYSSSLTSSYIEVSSSISSSELIQQVPAFPSEGGFPITQEGWYTLCPVSQSVSSSIVTTYTNVSCSFDTDVVTGLNTEFDVDGGTLQTNVHDFETYWITQTVYIWATDGSSPYFLDGGGSPSLYAKMSTINTPAVKFEPGWKINPAFNGQVLSCFFSPIDSEYRYPGVFSSGSNSTVNTDVYANIGECIRFEEACIQKYPNVRIKWKNRYGQYDYHNFYMVSKTAFNTTARSYAPQIGTWEGSTLSYPNYASSKLNYINDSSQTLSVNTNWLSEDYNDLFKQLLVSEEIYWVYGDDESGIRPITISTSNLQFKTGAVDKLIQYQFDFDWGQGYKLII